MAEWAQRDPVCVIPVATLEDHGYHLPIDTDVVIAETLADLAVQRCAGRALLLPTVTHGYTPHHMDFPGRSRSTGRRSSTACWTSAAASSGTASRASCS